MSSTHTANSSTTYLIHFLLTSPPSYPTNCVFLLYLQLYHHLILQHVNPTNLDLYCVNDVLLKYLLCLLPAKLMQTHIFHLQGSFPYSGFWSRYRTLLNCSVHKHTMLPGHTQWYLSMWFLWPHVFQAFSLSLGVISMDPVLIFFTLL